MLNHDVRQTQESRNYEETCFEAVFAARDAHDAHRKPTAALQVYNDSMRLPYEDTSWLVKGRFGLKILMRTQHVSGENSELKVLHIYIYT